MLDDLIAAARRCHVNRSEAPEIQVVGGAGTWRQVNWAIVQAPIARDIRSH